MEQESTGVAILLAVYNPRMDWLIELLDSLNAQTYPDLCLYVRDDASSADPDALQDLLHTHITRFPWVFHRNEQNLGSNGTFEALVRDCDRGEKYIAFCDQDDIWLPEKVRNGVDLLRNSPLAPVLVCSDVRIIDADGNVIAPDMEHHRRRHIFLKGNGLAAGFFFRNYVMGCTVVAERARVLSYLPFPEGIVHDHYLAFRSACDGAIDYLSEPQMLYRVYGGNQTGVMTGVTTKEDYFRERIGVFSHRLDVFSQWAPELPELPEIRAWRDARVRNFKREKGGFSALFCLRSLNLSASLFELFALRLPSPLFRLAVRLVQKRIL